MTMMGFSYSVFNVILHQQQVPHGSGLSAVYVRVGTPRVSEESIWGSLVLGSAPQGTLDISQWGGIANVGIPRATSNILSVVGGAPRGADEFRWGGIARVGTPRAGLEGSFGTVTVRTDPPRASFRAGTMVSVPGRVTGSLN